MTREQDAFAQFMSEASRYPLLTHMEEVELAQQVQAYVVPLLAVKEALIEKLNREPTASEWAEAAQITPETLTKQWLQGERARKRLMCCNLRLVISIAKKYQGRGLEMADMVQDGMLGLNTGVMRFDPTKGYRFSTYAYSWIRQSITRAIQDKSRTIRLPTHIWESLNVIRKTATEYSQQHGRAPSTREVGEMMLTEKKLKPAKCKKGQDPKAMAIAKIDQHLAMNRKIKSLHYVTAGNKDDELEIGNILECPRPRPEDVAADREQRLFARELLKSLTPKQRAVVIARYGLDGGPELPFLKVANLLGLDYRNVRTIHDRAIRNLRARLAGSDFVELLRGA